MLLLILTLQACTVWSVTESTDRGSYYFRMKASYTHDDQPIDFDIVVACGIRIDRYRGGESGFQAARYPRFFVKRTHDNHAVMQIVPIACRGETTDDGRVPKDFLPGVIWFDKSEDYRFGIAYVSEDAFENQNSQLKFHGASIERATLADWEAFRKRAADNEGMRRRYYDPPKTDDQRKIALADGREVEAAYARGCQGVVRYKLSAPGREIVRNHWPASRPRFWSTNGSKDGPWPELQQLERDTPIFSDYMRFVEHMNHTTNSHHGFATRVGAGRIWSNVRKVVPSEVFPARNDRGFPWVFSDEVAASQYLIKDVEVSSGPGKGFLYCFSTLNRGRGNLAIALPGFQNREARTRVDGEWVVSPERMDWRWISPFYERDEYIYFRFDISLS